MTHTQRRTSRAAFTITELLVVIGIIVLLIALAVPAFSNLLASSERALAENQLKAGLAAARDAAIQSEAGDGAAVFFFTPGGRVSIIPCIAVGEIQDHRGFPTSLTQPSIRREIFVPVPNAEPLQMPKGWSIRGFVTAGMVYTPALVPGEPPAETWYASYFASKQPAAGVGGWMFPETGFYDANQDIPGTNSPSGARRNSFMVRFKVGSGELDVSNNSTALVFDPIAQQGAFRNQQPFANYRSDQLRIGGAGGNVSDNYATYVRRVINTTGLTNIGQFRDLIGVRSPDTVLVRPVTELALYQESHLAAGIGASGLNRATGSLYGDPNASNDVPVAPTIDTRLLPAGIANAQDLSREIGEWIEGGGRDTDGLNGERARRTYDARIYTLSRYLGSSQEVKP